MNKDLISRWNAMVKPQDTVVFVGDFSMNDKRAEEISPLLNGKKIMVSGNHDGCFAWRDRPSYPRKCAKYLASGWAEIHQTMKISLKDGTRALVSHLPYAGEDTDKYDKRYQDYRPGKGEEDLIIHGHHHCKYLKKGNKIDVGIDNNFKLISEDEVIKIYMDKRQYIKARMSISRNPHGDYNE
jgi:calcineurin-like phosphoesterase family protein